MTNLSFALTAVDGTHDTIALDDMGEGTLVLSQTNEDGTIARVSLSCDQFEQARRALAPRYADIQTVAA